MHLIMQNNSKKDKKTFADCFQLIGDLSDKDWEKDRAHKTWVNT